MVDNPPLLLEARIAMHGQVDGCIPVSGPPSSLAAPVLKGNERRGIVLLLEVDDAGGWRDRTGILSQVTGCLDVDLEVTPATNTLPIRRLHLPLGESASPVAAWVRFPDLTVEPLPQEYRRTGEHRYRYQNRYELEVDDLGLVTRYADIWECIAQAGTSQ